MLIDINELLDRALSKGLTDDDICNATDTNRVTLWRWRTGRTKPHLSKLAKLLKVLNA